MKYDLYNYLGTHYYFRGYRYDTKNIRFIKREYDEKENMFEHYYIVKDMYNLQSYNVLIESNGPVLHESTCECENYKRDKSCEHIAAVLVNYFDELTTYQKNTDLLFGQVLLKKYDDDDDARVGGIKKKLNYKIEFNLDDGYKFRLLIGDDKLYVLTRPKLSTFIRNIDNGEDFPLGSKFTYNSNKYYIDDKLNEIIRFITGNGTLKQKFGYYEDLDPYTLSPREFDSLVKILGDDNLYLQKFGKILGVKYTMPKIFNLSKDANGNYVFSIEKENGELLYLPDNNFIYQNVLYIPNSKSTELINFFEKNDIDEVKFQEKDMPTFKKGLLKKVKNNLNIAKNVDEIVLPTKPKVNLYFDLDDNLKARVIFDYNGTKVNYFEHNTDSDYMRSVDDEKKVIEDISESGFREEKNKFIIDTDDALANFVENYLPSLTEKYNTFLNKNLQNANILTNMRVQNNFTIGKDNILSYNFSVDGLDKKDISGLLASIKKHQKYYRLKNNDLVNLEDNDELNKLSEITDDLNLSKDDIANGEAVIPKYRALYIDSLKSSNNIKTNGVFDKFIEDFKKYRNVDIKLDEKDKKIYRDYQIDGVKWLYSIYKCNLGGILADEMGLGKTLQTIGLIKLILKEHSDAKVLIVSPTSLVYNWQKEFEKFAPDLKFITVADNKKTREEIFKNKDDYNIFITSYGLIRNDNDEYETIDFELCVIDEAQAIKNYKAGMTREVKKIKAKCKIALTGTPVENNIFELWSIFDFIMPGYLNTLTKFKDRYNFTDMDDEARDKIKKLHEQIAPFILRRKKQDVLASLPDKIENKIYVELDETQKAVYVKDLHDTKEEMDDLIADGGYLKSQFKILSLLTRLREICIDPSVVYDNYKGESAKINMLDEIVKDNIQNGHKILIFSSFKRILDNVKAKFDKEGITSYMIDGSVKSIDRIRMVDAFNKDDTNCFLITLKAGGTGLNLTGADTVIHLDIWWNPAVENQATDRAHRIGQKKTVNVIKIITKGTIEERIVELQEKKKELADNLIENNSEDKIISKLTEKDIRNLLAYND